MQPVEKVSVWQHHHTSKFLLQALHSAFQPSRTSPLFSLGKTKDPSDSFLSLESLTYYINMVPIYLLPDLSRYAWIFLQLRYFIFSRVLAL